MEKKRCGYCGRYYDVQDEMTLENGSPACPQCVADEEKREKEREKAREEEKKHDAR